MKNILDEVQESIMDHMGDPKLIIIPEKLVKKFLRDIEAHTGMPKNTIQQLKGFKLSGIRVISSMDIDLIEVW